MFLDLGKIIIFTICCCHLVKFRIFSQSLLLPSIFLRSVAFAIFAMIALPLQAGMNSGFTQLLDAVVRIDVRKVNFEKGTKRLNCCIGSGAIISPEGLVVTNAHVTSPKAVEISVTLANLERVSAKLVGWDHWTDIALIRIDMDDIRRRKLSFNVATFGDSDKIAAGQSVYAVGTPYGLTRTVTRGIISNIARPFEDSCGIDGYEVGTFNNWLQTDASINPGNSGGPLVTEDGKIIGVNSRAYIGAENLGFSIPSNVVRRVVDGLEHNGCMTRSYIGLDPGVLQDLEDFYALEANTGMLINGVDPGSPAANAGIHPGDVVLAINDRTIDGRFPEQLAPIQNIIASFPVGSTIKLRVKRSSQVLSISAVTEKLESHVGEEWAFEKWGLSVRKVSRAFARENQLADDSGVLVIGVLSDYPAAKSGIFCGDIIIKVAGKTIKDFADLKAIYEAYKKNSQPTLIEAKKNRRISLHVFKP